MNKMSLKVFIITSILFLQNIPFAQQLSNLNSDEPIEIFADEGIEWHKNKNKYVAIGNAKAISGSLSLKSDRIEAFYKDKENDGMNIKEVRARKNVVVEDNKMKIVGGDYAEYKTQKDYFLIQGKKIILTSESNILKSREKLEFWRSKNSSRRLHTK